MSLILFDIYNYEIIFLKGYWSLDYKHSFLGKDKQSLGPASGIQFYTLLLKWPSSGDKSSPSHVCGSLEKPLSVSVIDTHN